MKNSFFLAATAAGALLAFGSIGPGHAQTAKPVVIGTDVDAGTLDPRLTRDTTAYRTPTSSIPASCISPPTLEPKPDLAESWQTPDPKTWTFKLRPGLKFSDGRPLTAEDVVFTYKTLLNPALNAPLRALYTPITRSRSGRCADGEVHAVRSLRPAAQLSRPRHHAEEAGRMPVKTSALKPVGAGR